MRILYHHRTLGDGAEGIHIREMVTSFRNLGHEVMVIGPTGEASGTISTKGSILASFKKCLPRFIFEILEIGYSLASFANLTAKAIYVRPDFIYDRYITFNFGTVLAAKLLGIPLYLEVNAPLALERSKEPDEVLIFQKVAFLIEKWTCRNSARTIVVSTPLKGYLISQGVPAAKISVMPNGVDPDKFAPRAKDLQLLESIGAAENDIVIGFTGILRSWHGLDLLISAVGEVAKNHSNVFLLIVGDGPIREILVTTIKEAGLYDRYHITGRVNYDDVPKFVNLFDIAVSPKATFYASPMKIMEYMALKKTVIVPNAPNFIDIIDDRLNGLTFLEDSSFELKIKLQHCVESPVMCANLGIKAREKVICTLNWKVNASCVCNYHMKISNGWKYE